MPFKLENQLIDGTLTRRTPALHALVIHKPNTAFSHVSKLLSLHTRRRRRRRRRRTHGHRRKVGFSLLVDPASGHRANDSIYRRQGPTKMNQNAALIQLGCPQPDMTTQRMLMSGKTRGQKFRCICPLFMIFYRTIIRHYISSKLHHGRVKP